MVFLNPLASTLKVWMVFFFVLNILFKSIWAWCVMNMLNTSEYVERPQRFGQWTMDCVVIMAEKDYTNHYLGTFSSNSAPSNKKIQLKQCPQHLGHLFKIISAPSNIRLKLKLCPQPIDGHFQLDSAPSRSNLQLIQCPQLLASAPSNKTSSQSCVPSYWLVPLAKLTPAKVVPLALQLISAPSRSNPQLIQCPQLLASATSNGSLQLNQCPQHLFNFYGPNGISCIK